MKKILLLTFGVFCLLSSVMVAAQTFTTAADTVWVATDSGGVFHNDITNISGQPIDISWSAPNHDLPQSWQDVFGICDAVLCRNNSVGTSNLFNKGPYNTTPAAPYLPNVSNVFDIQIGSGFGAAVSGQHYINISLRDITNPGSYTKTITYVINKFPTSVNKVTKPVDDVTLYPNPARSELNVLFNPDAGIKLISVYNLIGKAVTVYKLSSNKSAKLDIENLPSGIYFIRLIDGQGQVVATRKFTHQ